MFRLTTALAVVYAIIFSTAEVCAQAPSITLTANTPVGQLNGTFNSTGGGNYSTGQLTFAKVELLLKIVKKADGTSVESLPKNATSKDGKYTGFINHPSYDTDTYEYYLSAVLYAKVTQPGGQPVLEKIAETAWIKCGAPAGG